MRVDGKGGYAEQVIDLHTHVLPGIDDGPASLEESVALALAGSRDGVEVMAATPHVRPDHPRVVPGELKERCDRLAAFAPSPKIEPGGEVDLLWAQEASEEDLRLVSLAQRGTDLLIETPYGFLTPMFEEALFALRVKGYRVLLAHPERNLTLQQDTERLQALVAQGHLLQVTASSLADPSRRSRTARLA